MIKPTILRNVLTSVALLCAVCALAQSIERVEPPFWWRGMHNDMLQIMVYGQNIARTDVRINHDAVELVATHQLTSPNYQFVDVRIAPGAEATAFDIEFMQGDQVVVSTTYQLRARAQGSAERQGFNSTDVMYLITPDRFANGNPANDEVAGMREGHNRTAGFGRHGGDIEGIRQHLDYIKDMGFTAIWLNPVLENDQEKWSYHGYSTTDYYNVDPRFGTNEEYVRLSNEAASMGIGMIMDIIVNHCGSSHWWMDDPPSDDWINYYQVSPFVNTNHKKETLLDPYAAPGDRERMVKGWFVATMPDLNQRNPFMSTYLIQNSIWWIEYANLTGIRQDTYSYPFKEFMTDWTCAIMDEYPNFNIVGEEWVEDPAMISYWQRGKDNPDGNNSCLPSLMDFPMTMNLHRALREDENWGEGLIRLYRTLSLDYHYPEPDNLVIFPDNHDMSRIFTQVNEDYDLFKMAISYILTMRGIPQIYYGTEILMANPGTDSHGVIRSDFPGGWQGDQVNGFTGQGLSARARESQAFLRKLLTWRKDAQVIHHGDLVHYVPENGVYVYFRMLNEEVVMVVLNKNHRETRLALGRFADQIGNKRFGHDVVAGVSYQLGDQLPLPPKSALILNLTQR